MASNVLFNKILMNVVTSILDQIFPLSPHPLTYIYIFDIFFFVKPINFRAVKYFSDTGGLQDPL